MNLDSHCEIYRDMAPYLWCRTPSWGRSSAPRSLVRYTAVTGRSSEKLYRLFPLRTILKQAEVTRTVCLFGVDGALIA